jgi:hypothetical protein
MEEEECGGLYTPRCGQFYLPILRPVSTDAICSTTLGYAKHTDKRYAHQRRGLACGLALDRDRFLDMTIYTDSLALLRCRPTDALGTVQRGMHHRRHRNTKPNIWIPAPKTHLVYHLLTPTSPAY